MPLFGKRDEAEEHFKQAKRYADPQKKEFDLNQAIEEFKMAIALKPDEAKYHAELGFVYSDVPRLAVTRGINVPFSLSKSAYLAVAELEQAASLSKKCPDQVVLALTGAYVLVGEYEKAASCASLVKAGWVADLVAELVKTGVAEGPSADAAQAARRHIEQALTYRDLGYYEDAQKEWDLATEGIDSVKWFYRTVYELAS